MKIKHATTGKIGAFFVGPKCYLNETIRFGEVALCIARDNNIANQPYIWIIGGIEQLIDYVSLARSKGDLEDSDATFLLSKLDEAKKQIPKTAYERLASILSIEVEELKMAVETSQVCITAPVAGIMDYSESKPKYIHRTLGYTPIH